MKRLQQEIKELEAKEAEQAKAQDPVLSAIDEDEEVKRLQAEMAALENSAVTPLLEVRSYLTYTLLFFFFSNLLPFKSKVG